jgi:isoamylase
MHVDGFRFDLASILSRGPDGAPMRYPPVLWGIELSRPLADTKIIAEAWDAGGLYQVGYFPGWRWSEWNGKYRDDIRNFVKGDGGIVNAVATRMAGSSDMFGTGERPQNSINFVTAHDGFTLNDLVSYNSKHNEANGEGNRDGTDDNRSWNCGVEGPTDDPQVEALRARQVRNVFAILMLSQGVPMFTSGDEVRRTQLGNNNTYCQDELNWFDWDAVESHADTLRFARQMIAFRRAHPALRRTSFFSGDVGASGLRDIAWHGVDLDEPRWYQPGVRTLAFTLARTSEDDEDLHVMMNMDGQPANMEIPPLPGRTWHVVIDTSKPSPDDIGPGGDDYTRPRYAVESHTVAVLASRSTERTTRRSSARNRREP